MLLKMSTMKMKIVSMDNEKNPDCKSPGFFSFLQITFYFKIEVALAKSIHVS